MRMDDDSGADPFDDLFDDSVHVSSGDPSSDGDIDFDESVGIGVDENYKVCQAETSMAPEQVRKATFDAVHDAQKIDESDVVKEVTTGGGDVEPGVCYTVTYSGKVHKVSGLETLEDCALDGDHTHVKCSCALGRNGQVCAPKMKAMLTVNSLWTFRAFNVQCKPDDVDVDDVHAVVMQDDDDVGAPQPTHRKSLGLNFDMVDTQKRLIHGISALLNDVTGPDFKCEPAEAAHIMDSITKLQHFVNNLQTQMEMSQRMSKNSKMDGGGVSGMSNFDVIPVTGAGGDTSLIRKRGWHEKAVDSHHKKLKSKGKQTSMLGYLS